jgi:hypothetical protein
LEDKDNLLNYKDSIIKGLEDEILHLTQRFQRVSTNRDEETKTIELKDSIYNNNSLTINIDEMNINSENRVINLIHTATQDDDEESDSHSRTISQDVILQENIIYNTNYYLSETEPNLSETSRINIDNMTYEQLLELQERIGFVNKGLSLPEIEVTFC